MPRKGRQLYYAARICYTDRSDACRANGLTFFGLRSVTLVIPGTCFKPSFAIDFRAFFSLRECTWTDEPAPGPASPVSTSESELLDASSTSAPFFAGGSSGSSSILGLDMLKDYCVRESQPRTDELCLGFVLMQASFAIGLGLKPVERFFEKDLACRHRRRMSRAHLYVWSCCCMETSGKTSWCFLPKIASAILGIFLKSRQIGYGH